MVEPENTFCCLVTNFSNWYAFAHMTHMYHVCPLPPGAAVTDGAGVRAVTVSEVSNGQVYGVMNLSGPVKSLSSLESVVDVASAVSL